MEISAELEQALRDRIKQYDAALEYKDGYLPHCDVCEAVPGADEADCKQCPLHSMNKSRSWMGCLTDLRKWKISVGECNDKEPLRQRRRELVEHLKKFGIEVEPCATKNGEG